MQRVLKVSGTTPEQHDEGIVRAAQVLREGGLALIPTETVYGLGVAVAPLAQDLVDALNEHDACRNGQEDFPSEEGERPSVNGAPVPPSGSGYRRIFSVKHRELTQTVPWLVGGVDALDRYGYGVDPITRALAEAFWPGALTLIVHARENVPVYMQAADGTVALRCSASPVVAALIKACGCPLATTSANTTKGANDGSTSRTPACQKNARASRAATATRTWPCSCTQRNSPHSVASDAAPTPEQAALTSRNAISD